MRAHLLGVRGSTPAPGPDFVRYGGHTSCVAISVGDDPPRVVLDAGTGIRSLTARLAGAAYNGAILVSHLHWDHVQGLPFFVAGDREDASVDLYVPAQDGSSAVDLLERWMSPPSFPITPGELLGEWRFHTLEPGCVQIQGLTVTAEQIAHKGGRTFGYRVFDGSASLAYLPDHAPAAGITQGALDLAREVDVLLHDAQFVQAERRLAELYGHATVDDAIDFAVQAGARSLVLFHHGPARTDDQLEEILAGLDAPLPVTLAREGQTLSVTSSRTP